MKHRRNALVRASTAHRDAMLWMEDHFSYYESQPNCDQVHIDVNFKRQIWQDYKDEVGPKLDHGQKLLSEGLFIVNLLIIYLKSKFFLSVFLLLLGQFMTMWKQLFDRVLMRQVKKVTGKCWTCAYINEIRQKQKGKEVMEACKQLMIMHRMGYYMLERVEYRRRVQHAVHHNPTQVMSSIIDGASQNHCTIPYLGRNVVFQPGLDQHIEGVLTHGHGLTIYRSFPTVSADSDFTIFCLLSSLEKWRNANNGNYPETWYIQIGIVNLLKYAAWFSFIFVFQMVAVKTQINICSLL